MSPLRKLVSGFTCFALLAGAPAAIPPAFPLDPPVLAVGTIQVAFTPGDVADLLVIEAVHAARRQVLVQAFSFTHRRIGRALVEARRRGVDVQLIADREQTLKTPNNAIAEMIAGGIPFWTDGNHESAHNKVMVIDPETPEATVITGSYNFTYAAQHRNAENLLLIRGNAPLAQAYSRNWWQHREHSTPYHLEQAAPAASRRSAHPMRFPHHHGTRHRISTGNR